MSKTRTFVAIEIPKAQETRLLELQAKLATDAPGVRWSLAKPFHVTLAFLGDVDDTDLSRVCHAVGGAATGFAAFTVGLASIGAFPNARRPRTVWADLTGADLPKLVALQADLVRRIGEAGYRCDEASFRPHVTLGRVKQGKGAALDLTALLNKHAAWRAGAFTVTEVITFASTLTPEGPVYVPLARASVGR
jgi:2'-5' RNA ligase